MNLLDSRFFGDFTFLNVKINIYIDIDKAPEW